MDTWLLEWLVSPAVDRLNLVDGDLRFRFRTTNNMGKAWKLDELTACSFNPFIWGLRIKSTYTVGN